ncbi:hypothetical protein HMI55_004241 [Coelomomyces lativittatus]|nr:hypothetical protein HMI55_004241 [Coelomomyces lativittatus]
MTSFLFLFLIRKYFKKTHKDQCYLRKYTPPQEHLVLTLCYLFYFQARFFNRHRNKSKVEFYRQLYPFFLSKKKKKKKRKSRHFTKCDDHYLSCRVEVGCYSKHNSTNFKKKKKKKREKEKKKPKVFKYFIEKKKKNKSFIFLFLFKTCNEVFFLFFLFFKFLNF